MDVERVKRRFEATPEKRVGLTDLPTDSESCGPEKCCMDAEEEEPGKPVFAASKELRELAVDGIDCAGVSIELRLVNERDESVGVCSGEKTRDLVFSPPGRFAVHGH